MVCDVLMQAVVKSFVCCDNPAGFFVPRYLGGSLLAKSVGRWQALSYKSWAATVVRQKNVLLRHEIILSEL